MRIAFAFVPEVVLVLVPVLGAGTALAVSPTSDPPAIDAVGAKLDPLYPELDALYVDLHRHPELSGREERTAAALAAHLRAAGFEVTTGVGGHGVVGLLRNGPGPTVMLRADLDALPIQEETGLPHASVNAGVMHACGHDVHMTAWLGAGMLLAGMKDRWKGTLMMVGQPAEEIGSGAKGMLAAGLFEKHGRPDAAIAFHVSPDLPSGTVGWRSGPTLASADSVDLTFRGRGGHGAKPHDTIDPIVIAARFVTSVQTLVSRENDPLDPAVVTVGSFHAGTKHNVIPDEARLQLTVRSYRQDVRERLLRGVERIARAEAAAAGAPEPLIEVSQGARPTINDAALASRVANAWKRSLGEARVVEVPPIMAAEDFSEYGAAGIPAAIFWLGTVETERLEAARAGGQSLPSLHSSRYAPDRERSLRTGTTALALAVLELTR